MPYKITRSDPETEKAAMEACPFGCIRRQTLRPGGEQRLGIDAETCTDCGACALAAPKGAIVPVTAVSRYRALPHPTPRMAANLVGSIGGWDGRAVEDSEADAEEFLHELQIPELTLNGKVEWWSDVMSSAAD